MRGRLSSLPSSIVRPQPPASTARWLSQRRTPWAVLAGLLACGEPTSEPPPPPPPPYVPPPASTLVDSAPVAIRREVLRVAAPAPPPNPNATTFAETPPENNFVRVVRYRL
ncbi:MAG TPA: hypothetical protein PKI03_09115, partial [Pseudomonadota bacterium]|nr:hypothetical protein [Pseudomonadota bacterium]